jgi:hypothetical protein
MMEEELMLVSSKVDINQLPGVFPLTFKPWRGDFSATIPKGLSVIWRDRSF